MKATVCVSVCVLPLWCTFIFLPVNKKQKKKQVLFKWANHIKRLHLSQIKYPETSWLFHQKINTLTLASHFKPRCCVHHLYTVQCAPKPSALMLMGCWKCAWIYWRESVGFITERRGAQTLCVKKQTVFSINLEMDENDTQPRELHTTKRQTVVASKGSEDK